MMDAQEIQRLIQLDHAHVWHPFTPMRQWRESDPIIIESGDAEFLFDVHGKRYIDGVSSLWANVHGHRVKEIDDAIRAQLDRVAHSTMLGLANVPATELAGELVAMTPGDLTRVFYTDSGATATEVAFKMAVGYWFHRGQDQRHTFLALTGAYHGDTTGAMSVGYSDLFHRPFRRMTFQTEFVDPPHITYDSTRAAEKVGERRRWPLEDDQRCAKAVAEALAALDAKLCEVGGATAGIVLEPLVQGAAGMVMQPPAYVQGVAELAKKHGTLLIVDEVATGFGRTGEMFACDRAGIKPDLLCLGKGLSGGYLPVAATLCTEEIGQAFEGELGEHRTLYHGHTFTGNPLGCAASLASIKLLQREGMMAEVREKAGMLARLLDPLRDADGFPQVVDVRQCGLMLGIELHAPPTKVAGNTAGQDGGGALGDFGETASPAAPGQTIRRPAYEACMRARDEGLLIRPLGNVIILMPPLAIRRESLEQLAETTINAIEMTTY
ncbi:MAG: adenosylmethionine--8-amino-7-oxononanoate transaminase [Phycisphaeraceae bacterium]